MSGDNERTFLTSLRTGNVLAMVGQSFDLVNYRSLGDEEDDHLCYVRSPKKLFQLCSGTVLFMLSLIVSGKVAFKVSMAEVWPWAKDSILFSLLRY